MQQSANGRRFWWGLLATVILAGGLSRAMHTGVRLLDKYLGDALYAAMVYILLRLTGRIERVALWAAVTMGLIEVFQLTGVASAMLRSDTTPVRLIARLLGTHFSMLDLLAYAVGIGCIAVVDSRRSTRFRRAGGAPQETEPPQ